MKNLFIIVAVISCFSSLYAQRGNRGPMIVTNTPGVPRVEGSENIQNSVISRGTKKAPTTNQNTNQGLKVIRQMNIMPLGEGGGLLSNLNSDDEFIYLHTEAYNKDIENLWRSDFKITQKFDFIGEQFDSTFHFALFNQFLKKNHVILLKTSTKTGVRKQMEANLPDGMKIITFRVVGEECFLACVYKERPVVILFDSNSGNYKALPNLLDRNAKFLSLYADNQTFTVVLKQMGKGNLLIKKYSKEGKLLHFFDIPEANCHYNEAKITDLGNSFLMVGTYSKGWRYKLNGLYVATINQNFTEKKLNFYPFTDLIENQPKVAPFAVTHSLKKTNGGVIGGVELFDANIINQDYAGRIKYDNGLIFKLDSLGEFVWKTKIPMAGVSNFIYAARLPYGITTSKTELLESNVKPLVKILLEKDYIIGAFQVANAIQTLTINQVSGQKISFGQYQEQKNENIIGFSPWYKSNFLVWGRDRSIPFSSANLYMRRVEVVKPDN